jgi:hypothetical protein
MTALHIHEDASRTTPVGLARFATEFMEAALAADDKMGLKLGFESVAPTPVMFLVGQAIELALKAYLLAQGESLRSLRRDYGHELHRSVRKCKELGFQPLLQLSEEEAKVLALLDALYSSKQLQYIVTGSKVYPMFGPLQRVALKLIHGAGAHVGYPVRNLPNAV